MGKAGRGSAIWFPARVVKGSPYKSGRPDAHLPLVRDAICDCFDEFKSLAGEQLTWLFREDPPEGRSASKLAYEKAKPMRAMMADMDEDDAVSFHYTSGKRDTRMRDLGSSRPLDCPVGVQRWGAGD